MKKRTLRDRIEELQSIRAHLASRNAALGELLIAREKRVQELESQLAEKPIDAEFYVLQSEHRAALDEQALELGKLAGQRCVERCNETKRIADHAVKTRDARIIVLESLLGSMPKELEAARHELKLDRHALSKVQERNEALEKERNALREQVATLLGELADAEADLAGDLRTADRDALTRKLHEAVNWLNKAEQLIIEVDHVIDPIPL